MSTATIREWDDVARLLRSSFERKGVKLVDMATAAGTHSSRVSAWLSGQEEGRAVPVAKLALALDLTPNQLLLIGNAALKSGPDELPLPTDPADEGAFKDMVRDLALLKQHSPHAYTITRKMLANVIETFKLTPVAAPAVETVPVGTTIAIDKTVAGAKITVLTSPVVKTSKRGKKAKAPPAQAAG